MNADYSLERAVEFSRELKNTGKKLVFTNGCFDLLHRGHVDYLLKARELGDALMLGLNSDSSVRSIKGENRPIVDEEDRAFLLSQFRFIDHVVIFSEDTPLNTIESVLPDVLVKGGDWSIDKIVGREVVEANGGKVCNIPLVEGRSTSNIIDRILKTYS